MTEVFKYEFKEEDLANLSTTKFIQNDKNFLKIINEVRSLECYYKKYHVPSYTDFKIIKYKQVLIKPGDFKDNFECRNYSYKQNAFNINKAKLDKFLPLFYGNADSFQHFLMHAYPILVFISEYLIQNPDIVIGFYPIQNEFDSFEYLINKLKLKNKIYFTREKIFALEGYIIEINPFQNYTYLPPNVVRKTHSILSEKSEQNMLIYIGRKNLKTRNDINHKDVCDFLQNYADKNDLIFEDFEHKKYNFEYRFNLLRKAKILIYIHGGAGYNIYFCNKNTKIIEFNFCASVKELNMEEDPRKPRKSELFDVLEYIANPIGFDFYGIVIEKKSKYSKEITIPINKLKQILL